jgi:hypothetical protein
MFKKVFAVILALSFAAAGTIGVSAEDGPTVYTSGDFKYEILEDGTAEIFRYIGGGSVAEIPDSVDGYTVTSVDALLFNNSNLTSVNAAESSTKFSTVDGVLFDKAKTTLLMYPRGRKDSSYAIPDGVTDIGNYAFEDCDDLTSINIPDGVINMGIAAFRDCDNLTSVTIPDSVRGISNAVFEDCDNLMSVTIPDSVPAWGYDAFWDCPNLVIYANSGSYAWKYALENGISLNFNYAIIVIIAIAAVVLAAGAVVTILIVKKKKAK